MRKHLIIAGLLATTAASAVLAPQVAAAQDRCEQIQHDNRVTGTVLGAVGGAILGGVVAGNRGHKEDGAIVGAVAGGFIGNQIAGSQPCPEGYRRVDEATYGLHQREYQLDQRIRGAINTGQLDPREGDRALGRLGDIRAEEGDMRAHNGGRLIEPDRAILWDQLNDLERRIPWRAAPPPPAPPPPPPPVYDEWRDAPLTLHEREAWIDQRIHMHADDRRLAPDDARRLFDQLRWIRDEEYWMVQDHGYLTPADEQNLQNQLGNLVQRFRHVMAH